MGSTDSSSLSPASPSLPPQPGRAVDSPPAWPAQLRQMLVTYFDESDIASLCFDFGVDYESLEGDGKQRKAIELIKEMGRQGRTGELIDACARQRPNASWDALRADAAGHPEAVFPSPPKLEDPANPGGRSMINLPPDRALKLGVLLGALMMLLVACGFSGGLVAGRFIQFTGEPVRPNAAAAASAGRKIEATGQQPAGDPVDLVLNNVEMTSLAAQYAVMPESPLNEIHIRFTDQSEIAVNMRLRDMGNVQVVAAYTADIQDARLVISPKAVAANILGLKDTTFGWVAVPAFIIQPFTAAAQNALNQASQAVAFKGGQIGDNYARVWGTRK